MAHRRNMTSPLSTRSISGYHDTIDGRDNESKNRVVLQYYRTGPTKYKFGLQTSLITVLSKCIWFQVGGL
jgi:hypothetical protein